MNDVKGPFHDPQPHFFSKKVEIFTSVEAFKYINVCVQNKFFQIQLFGGIIAELQIY